MTIPPSSLSASERALARIGAAVQQKYLIDRLIGIGGMAAVYAAKHRNGHWVAIKFLLERFSSDPDMRRLFAREAYIANRVGHPGAVPVLDDDVDEHGCPFLIMPLLDGVTLRAHWDRANKRLPLAEAGVLMMDALDVLASAHANGIVHRDIKPDNLFVTTKGDVRVLDFGIARHLENAGSGTVTGRLIGTPAFMPPEQAIGDRSAIGPHSDCWAAGATLFALLSGEFVHPTDGAPAGAQFAAAATWRARSLGDLLPNLPSPIVQFVDQSLSFEPTARWRDGREMHDALQVALSEALDEPIENVTEQVRTNLIARLLPKGTDADAIETQPPERDQDDAAQGAPRALAGGSSKVPTVHDLELLREPTSSWWSIHKLARKPRFALLAIVTVLAIGIFFRVALFDHSGQGPASIAETSPPGTSIMALSLPTCTPAAVALYRQGLQALREAGWTRAHSLFGQAAKQDPSCPEVQFRLVITGELLSPPSQEREQLRRAVALRDSLSERDRLILDAWALIVAPDKAHEEEASRVLDEAVARFPNDAELLDLTTIRKLNLVRGRKELETELERMRRATEIDPGYADAWQLRARILGQLGRADEVIEALGACLKAAPGAVDCMQERVIALRNHGQCGAAVAEAKRWISWDPEEPLAYRQLAYSLAADNASRETIEEALNLSWNRLRIDERPAQRLFEESRLAIWMGEFEEALRKSDELERSAQGSAAGVVHWRAALTSIDTLIELGQSTRAASLAEHALARKDAWLRNGPRWQDSAYSEPFLRAAELLGGRLTLTQWRDASDAWERANAARIGAFERWVLRWGTSAGETGTGATPDLAEALRYVPSSDPNGIHDLGTMSSLFHSHIRDAYEGRLRLFAGETSAAAPLLEHAARACQSLHLPFLNIRAHLWLGIAKERLGERAAACEAYRFVLARWGHAKPPSISAQDAERRARLLGCE